MDDEFIYADELSFHILMAWTEVTSPDSNLTSARSRKWGYSTLTVTVSPIDELQPESTNSDPLRYVIFEEYFRNIVTYSDISAGAHSAGRFGRSLLEVGTNHKA